MNKEGESTLVLGTIGNEELDHNSSCGIRNLSPKKFVRNTKKFPEFPKDPQIGNFCKFYFRLIRNFGKIWRPDFEIKAGREIFQNGQKPSRMVLYYGLREFL